MKKIILWAVFLLILSITNVYGVTQTFTKNILTGGTSGCLDQIDGDDLNEGDRALVVTDTYFYVYTLDADSGAVAASPSIIKPVTNSGLKRWKLVGQNSLQAIDIIQRPTTTSTTSVKLNKIQSLDDTMAIGTGASGFGITLAVDNQFGGATTKGGRVAIQAYTELTEATDPAGGNRNYVGLQANAAATASDGGTATTAADSKGAIIGLGAWGSASAGATNLKHVNGITVNYGLNTGSSAYIKEGMVISAHTTDKVAAAGIDTALAISRQTGSIGQKTGIVFTDVHGDDPVKLTGSLIATDGACTVTNGIDFSSYTFYGSAFKSTGFAVNGLGGIVSETAHPFRSIYGDYGAILRNDGTGLSFLMTDALDQTGTYNALRPLTIQLASGNVYMGSGALYVAHGGSTGVGDITPTTKLDVDGPIATAITAAAKTTDYEVTASDSSLIFAGTSTITLTLPTASACEGRNLHLKNIAGYTVVSASSNVVPLTSATAGTAILAAAAGKWAQLQSNGTAWVIMAGN